MADTDPIRAVATPSDIFDLTGRTALVTGASSGLGYRMALVLAYAGATVAVTARRTDRLNALAAEHPSICLLYTSPSPRD